MDYQEIEGLLSSFGFVPTSKDKVQKKTRFHGEETFLDLWQGRKGTTLGVYEKKSGSMWFTKPHDLEDIEDVLIRITK